QEDLHSFHTGVPPGCTCRRIIPRRFGGGPEAEARKRRHSWYGAGARRAERADVGERRRSGSEAPLAKQEEAIHLAQPRLLPQAERGCTGEAVLGEHLERVLGQEAPLETRAGVEVRGPQPLRHAEVEIGGEVAADLQLRLREN